MLARLTVVCLFCLFASSARADLVVTAPSTLVSLGFCSLTPTVATALSACPGGIPKNATIAVMSVTTASVNYRDDGVAPTTAVGGGVTLPMTASGLLFVYTGRPLSAFQAISATGVLNIMFYQP